MKIEIDPRAVVAEQMALIEHYRNRNLLLADRLLRLEEENTALQNRIQEIENVPHAEPDPSDRGRRGKSKPIQEDR